MIPPHSQPRESILVPDVNLSDDEECKLPVQVSIPIPKTNMKEGRVQQHKGLSRPMTPISTFLSDIVKKPQESDETKSLDKYRENLAFVEAPTRKLKNFS